MSTSAFPHATMAAAASVAPTVSLNTNGVANSDDVSTVWACLRYGSDGVEYTNSNPNNYEFNNTVRGNWLDSGSSSAVWLERTINSGTLWEDAGAGRLNMATNRNFVTRDANPAGTAATCNLTINMYDAASGGNNLGTATFTLSANYFNPCPTCCFTPDTLVTMADGSLIPISEVQVGDMIRVMNGIEPVTEVITRVSRPMCRLTFADGRTLLLTTDHPIFVEGKGYASVNPNSEYKDAGRVRQLEAGDYAVTDSGLMIKVVGIDHNDYLGTVYTFGNKNFFAGGVLVY